MVAVTSTEPSVTVPRAIAIHLCTWNCIIISEICKTPAHAISMANLPTSYVHSDLKNDLKSRPGGSFVMVGHVPDYERSILTEGKLSGERARQEEGHDF